MIRIVQGAALGQTAKASFDAALADANIHNYNLISVSSIIPHDQSVEISGTAPDLGPIGNGVRVVGARKTAPPQTSASAGIIWGLTPDGHGLFYEDSGTDKKDIAHRLKTGIEAGRDLREWTFTQTDSVIERQDADASAYATAVVYAVYGESFPIL